MMMIMMIRMTVVSGVSGSLFDYYYDTTNRK